MNNENKYKNIINRQHHISDRHPPLSKASYAAQFSPFAALTGYDGIVSEAARVTDEKMELDDYAKSRLSDKLSVVFDHIDEEPEITLTFFVPDKRKSGGSYSTVTGYVRKFDEYEKTVILTDGTVIPVSDLFEIRGDIIDRYLPDDF